MGGWKRWRGDEISRHRWSRNGRGFFYPGLAGGKALLKRQFFSRPVTVRNVHVLQIFKRREQLPGGDGVVAVLLKLRDLVPLDLNVLLAERNVLFGFRKTLLTH